MHLEGEELVVAVRQMWSLQEFVPVIRLGAEMIVERRKVGAWLGPFMNEKWISWHGRRR